MGFAERNTNMIKMPRVGMLAGMLCLLIAAIGANVSLADVPQWIKAEKVRASYSSQWNSEDLPAKVAGAKFNSMLIQFCNGTDHFEKWSRLTKENNLHFFAGLWLDYLAYAEAIHGPGGAGPKAMSTYRAFVHRDTGPHTAILCPADSQYWADWVMPTALDMAKLSLKDKVLDGIVIDAELYGPLTTKPAIPVSFYMDVGPCMCDDCFGDFLTKTKAKEKLADFPWKDRHGWLVKGDLTLKYNLHLRDRVAALARQMEKQVHAINPDLLLGSMNWYKNEVGAGTSENYVLIGIRDGLKTPEKPVMIWTEYPEYESGYGPYTDARYEHFKSVGDVIYIPGLFMEELPPNRLNTQIHDLAAHSDGYWIFTRDTDLLVNPYILNRFKMGNDNIIAAAPPRSELPFMDLWADYDPVLNLNKDWSFRTDLKDVGIKEKWFTAGRDSDQWKPIEVGKFWDEQLGTAYTGVAWYRATVEAPADVRGKDLYLAFGAVDEEARVWLNGQLVGSHEKGSDGWDDRFLIPLKQRLIPGKPNTIAVRVSNTMLSGGIWQPVRLIARKQK